VGPRRPTIFGRHPDEWPPRLSHPGRTVEPVDDTSRIEALIAASSLGTPGASRLAATVPDDVAKAIVARSHRRSESGMCDMCHGEPAETKRDSTDLCGDCAEAWDHYESLTADDLALDLLAQALHVTESEML
jgi:hypothetical protein